MGGCLSKRQRISRESVSNKRDKETESRDSQQYGNTEVKPSCSGEKHSSSNRGSVTPLKESLSIVHHSEHLQEAASTQVKNWRGWGKMFMSM